MDCNDDISTKRHAIVEESSVCSMDDLTHEAVDRPILEHEMGNAFTVDIRK